MSKVFCVVRATNECTFDDCISALKRLRYPYVVIKDDSSLEEKVKKTIEIGIKKRHKYDWIMTVDGDVIINRSVKWVEQYCKNMEMYGWFCFTGWLDCTRRGLISGLHFYKADQCEKVYNIIRDKDFSFHKGRPEYEVCKLLKGEYGMNWDTGKIKESFGIHLFNINQKV